MADATKLSDDVLDDLAQQATRRLIVSQDVGSSPFLFMDTLTADPLSPSSELRLGETFEVWRITPVMVEAYAGKSEDIIRFAEPTGRLHHQIKLVGDAKVYARSKPSATDAGKLSLRELVTSSLATKIDKGVRWADKHKEELPDDMVARLLVSPLYQMVALWFVNKSALTDKSGVSKVLIVSARSDSRLPLMSLLNSSELVELLDREPTGRGLSIE
jgi:hypothetical protein